MSASRNLSIFLIVMAEISALALWFSATAVIPALRAEAGLDDATASLYTSAVQAGFVIGTLLSAALILADRLNPRLFFIAAALAASAANAVILVLDPNSATVIAMRFLTGLCMAGIYPIGMKLVASWAKGDMGLMVGLLVGALTFGSATPHLFNALGGTDWRLTVGAASVAAVLAAILMAFVAIGPNIAPSPAFDPRHALKAWTTPSLRLANLGYLGHMWELYAMWAWIVVFLDASFRISQYEPSRARVFASIIAFATIAIGGLGSVAGGLFADRWGRTTLTMLAMAISGLCALAAGFFFGADPALVTILCLIWGFAIVADSAQFSASIAELSERSLVGTMLTIQTSMGFLLTLVTIHLLPILVDQVGWRYAFAFLAVGPFVGVAAMWRLRAHPDSLKLAGGRR